MFSFFKNQFQKIYNSLTSKLQSLFSSKKIDQDTLQQLELLLIEADTGLKTTTSILATLQKKYAQGSLEHGQDLKNELATCLDNLLVEPSNDLYTASVYLLVGINGSGKTTSAAKIAYSLQQQNKRIIFVAADTFRAAAVQQLEQWAQQLNIPVIKGAENQDPASVVFAGCTAFKTGNYDTIIIDTAGRLQTKANLMKELEKIKKIVAKQIPDKRIVTLLTIDSMLGQNSLEQARIFNESTQLDGLILTKMDGTGKGGIVFAISNELKLPVAYISFGEKLNQLKPFEPEEFVAQLLD